MDPMQRSLFDTMGKNSEKHTPEEWARLAWKTAFVCKRSGKEKAPQSQRNAIHKCEAILGVFAEKGLVSWRWVYDSDKQGHRRVFWRGVVE